METSKSPEFQGLPSSQPAKGKSHSALPAEMLSSMNSLQAVLAHEQAYEASNLMRAVSNSALTLRAFIPHISVRAECLQLTNELY